MRVPLGVCKHHSELKLDAAVNNEDDGGGQEGRGVRIAGGLLVVIYVVTHLFGFDEPFRMLSQLNSARA